MTKAKTKKDGGVFKVVLDRLKAKANAIFNKRAPKRKGKYQANSAVGTVSVGKRVRGKIKKIVDYGAFVELEGGVQGLLHVTNIEWKRTNITEAFSKGDEVEVMVLSVDRDKGHISLGMKQLQPNPWELFERAHPVGSRMSGKVTRALEYGVFVELEGGVQGMVHSSDMSWTRKHPNPLKLYSPGDEVEVMILAVDVEHRRISLGIKQCTPNPWQDFAAAYRKGHRLNCKVRSVSEFGVFMELPGGIDGLVRMSELSYDRPGEEVAREYKKGQEIEVVILSVDAERERVSLGVKQLGDAG